MRKTNGQSYVIENASGETLQVSSRPKVWNACEYWARRFPSEESATRVAELLGGSLTVRPLDSMRNRIAVAS